MDREEAALVKAAHQTAQATQGILFLVGLVLIVAACVAIYLVVHNSIEEVNDRAEEISSYVFIPARYRLGA